MVLRIISALAFGAMVGGIIGSIATGDPRYTILWSVALPVGILTGMWGLFSLGKRATPAAPIDPSQLALARVERITRTGFSVNDQPQCELQLTVAPRFRPAYTTTHRQIVDLVALAQVQPGSIVVVRRPDEASADVEVVFEPPADWAALRQAEQLRTGTERTVPLAAEAPVRESDPARRPAAPGASADRPHPARVAAWWALVAIAAAVTLVPAYPSIGRTVSALAAGNPAQAGVVEGDRHAEIVDALAAETGGTQFVRIGFYGDYAIASAPSSPGALTIDAYQYRYDRTERQGPELIQPEDPAAALFDASEVDFSRIPGYIAAAKASSGIADPTSIMVSVSRTPVADESGEMPVQVLVSLDSPYEDASVVFDATTGEPAA
ncbi:hypothetical protein ACGGZK_06135 [Agromyces sp. MMS24-K17]|uniref:hypothetical protein n=1 Tax=Agromyces sp. MMS24-K17 TaxID=3372850 RepID=UPI003754AB73